MLRKKNQSAGTSATDVDVVDEDEDGVTHGLDDYGTADSETLDADDETAEYDEEAVYEDEDEYDEDEYDETAQYDDDQYDEDGEYDDEEYDEDEDGEFTPPTATAAIKRSWLSSRPRAQPATGTEEDGKKVNFIDKRERMIGYFLGVMLIALAIASYFVDRHYVDKTNLKLQHEIHSEAPWILVITLVLGTAILLSTYFKRRAAVGFTLLLAGVALFNSDFLIGIIYLGTGLWLVFRSMRKSPRAAAAGAGGGTTRASRVSTASRSRTTPTSSRSSASTTTPAKSVPGRTIGRNNRIANTTAASGRYTPPKPQRHAPPTVQPDPEPTNKLSAWLKK
ncbi:MAG: hypothetical protein ABSE47_09880 [Acidimicrobiales bacterium]